MISAFPLVELEVGNAVSKIYGIKEKSWLNKLCAVSDLVLNL